MSFVNMLCCLEWVWELWLWQIINLHLCFDDVKWEAWRPHENSWSTSCQHHIPDWWFLTSAIHANWALPTSKNFVTEEVPSIPEWISCQSRIDTSIHTSESMLWVDFSQCIHTALVEVRIRRSTLHLHPDTDMLNRTRHEGWSPSSKGSSDEVLTMTQVVWVPLLFLSVFIYHHPLYETFTRELYANYEGYSSQGTHSPFVECHPTLIL